MGKLTQNLKQSTKALINKQTTILHESNDVLSENVDENLYGYEVEILEKFDNGFSKIKTHYDYIGVVQNDDLEFNLDRISDFNNSNKMIINHYAVDVRNKPKVQGVTLITLTKGCIVTVLENNDGWVKTKLISGEIGYIKEKFLTEIIEKQDFKKFSSDEVENFRQNVVKVAKEYMTAQYRWGGKSPLGIDCSGLTSMAYMLNGVIIYRDAKIVEEFPVKKISFDELQPADLIYFPGHIAMYIGNGEYIHSSAGNDGVYINSFDKNSVLYKKQLAETVTACGSIFV